MKKRLLSSMLTVLMLVQMSADFAVPAYAASETSAPIAAGDESAFREGSTGNPENAFEADVSATVTVEPTTEPGAKAAVPTVKPWTKAAAKTATVAPVKVGIEAGTDADAKIGVEAGTNEIPDPKAPASFDTALAANGDVGDDDTDSDSYAIHINGYLADEITIEYGEPLTFTLDGFDPSIYGQHDVIQLVFSYATEEDKLNKIWTPIVNGSCTVEPGDYYLKYDLTVNDQWYHDDDFTMTVIKGTVGAPRNLLWSGSHMSWDAATVTDKGGSLDANTVTGYSVKLYHNGAEHEYTTGADTLSITNLAGSIIGEYGAGEYSFTVQARISDTDPHYAASAVSGVCGTYTVPNVTLGKDDGISSVATSPSADSFLLLPGEASYNSRNITASVSAGYAFQSWVGEGVTFGDASAANTVVTVNPDYSGSVNLTLTATSKDIIPPTVDSFSAGAADGTLTAKASDGQRGVAYYAFSTAAASENVADSEWKAVAGTPAAGQITAEHELTDGGVYYFYAKDTDGNITRSTSGIRVTKVTLHDYNHVEDSKDIVIYRMNESVALPVPTCGGYNFLGWYNSQDFSGDAVTAPAHSTDTPIELYGKWEIQQIVLPALSDAVKTYDGQDTVLSVNLTNTGALTYQWYKGGNPISGETGSSLTLKNVNDSGTYKLSVTLKDSKGAVLATADSNQVSVVINRRPVLVCADNKTVYYGDNASYTYTYTKTENEGTAVPDSGMISGDESSVTAGELTCSYSAGDPQGTYPIGFSAGNVFSADNYTFTYKPGTLTVLAKVSNLTAVLADPAAEHIYTGSAITPAVVVKDGDEVLSRSDADTVRDYRVQYINNTDVGTATAKVIFEGNYSGEIDLDFEIQKASFSATMTIAGWKYGDTASTPAITEGCNKSNGSVTYYYKKTANSDGTAVSGSAVTTVKPVNAGSYEVYAVIAETANYGEVTTPAVSFVITRREISIHSNSATFGYDGQPHSDHGYAVTGDGFAAGEGFSHIIVTGSQTAVTDGVDNGVEYALNSITNPDNYVITIVPGKLTVTKVSLTTPANSHWESDRPGVASWIAVSKSGLTAQYELRLYVKKNGVFTRLGDVRTITSTECDFSDAIRTDAANGDGGSYFFTIKTTSTGDNAENYYPSDESEKYGELFTAIVTAYPGANVNRVEAWRYGESTIPADNTVVLISGEKACLGAYSNTGYTLSGWDVTGGLTLSSSKTTVNRKSVHILSTDGITSSVVAATATAKSKDTSPDVKAYTAVNTSDYGVELSFKLTDGVGLAAYAISTDSTRPESGSALWIPLNGETTYEGTYAVTAPGTYYIYVKDTAGNTDTFYRVEPGTNDEGEVVNYLVKDGKVINRITLKAGTGTGTDKELLKAANTSITLPDTDSIGFEKAGYSFCNWYGSTGIYEQSGAYSENTNDELTAKWTNQFFDYTVNYYYMDTDGNYPATPKESASYNVVYNTEICTSTPSIQRPVTGFERDDANHSATISVVSSGMSIDIYYARKQYTLTYTYTYPGDTSATTIADTYYYGADLSNAFLDENKPHTAGHSFSGWTFGEAGSMPETMPAANVVATGEFVPLACNVHYRFFAQDLDQVGYTMNPAMSRQELSRNGEEITLDAESADLMDGFTFKSAYATYGSAYSGTTEPAGATESFSADAVAYTAGETYPAGITGELYINVFYTRNTYTITLNVWQGTVGTGTLKFTRPWSFLYGASLETGSITAEQMETFEIDNWEHDSNYILASYSDWSTGSRPATMPAGNVTLTRQFVLQTTGKFILEVWIEGELTNAGDPNGVYSLNSFTYYNNVGSLVTVGNGTGYTVNYSTLRNTISYFDYYDYRVVTDEEITDGTIVGTSTINGGTMERGYVTDTTNLAEPAVLRIFLERKTIPTTITYKAQYLDGEGTGEHLVDRVLATVTKESKWGTTHTYNIEPFGYFYDAAGGTWSSDPISITSTNMVSSSAPDGGNPDTYNYWQNCYVISYSGRYSIYDDTHYYADSLDTVASLAGIYTRPVGYANNTVTVNYTTVYPDRHYYLDTRYDPSNLDYGYEYSPAPLKCSYNGTDYRVRIANEAYFYPSAHYVVASEFAAYPGLGMYNPRGGDPSATDGRHIYSTSDPLRPGFSKIDIGGKTYYFDGTYIYIAVPDNRFFYGNLASWGYNSGNPEIGYQTAVDFLENIYKPAHSDSARAQGAYIYNRGWGSTICWGNSTLTINYRNGYSYTLVYYFNGNQCSNHTFAPNSQIDETNFGCTHDVFLPMTGFDVVWYRDSGFNNPVTLPFNITSSMTVYGRYEKQHIVSTEYAYYELADYVQVGDTTYSYITQNDLAAFEGNTDLVKVENADGSAEWTYKGAVVMKSKPRPSETFKELSMNIDDYDDVDGLLFDDKNKDNNLIGYAEAAPITLRAYFARETYNMVIDEAIPGQNATTVTMRNGQRADLGLPVRNGYSFDGWTITDEEDVPLDESYITRNTDKTASVTFPRFNLKVTANWVPANYNQEFVHYYQNPSLGFDTALVDAMRADSSASSATFTVNGINVTGLAYSSGGASYSDGTKTYYYSTVSDGNKLEAEYLSAIVIEKSVLQDKTEQVADFEEAAAHYNFAYAFKKLDGTIASLNETDTYANAYGMVVEYYYTLETNLSITLSHHDMKGTSLTTTMNGAGTSYYYSEVVPVSVGLPAGYDFVGWYQQSSYLDGDNQLLESAKITTEQSFDASVKGHEKYVAVVSARDVDKPSLEIKGIGSLVYDYIESPLNQVTVLAAFPETADSSNYVQAYQWYEKNSDGTYTVLANGNSATYLVPVGWETGVKTLRCKITVGRHDNGRSDDFYTDDYNIEVTSNQMKVGVKNYSGIYDAEYHSVSLSVASLTEGPDYEIYYDDEPLTAENYTANGSLTNPSFKNVATASDGSTVPYTVYYYIKSKTPNYQDNIGSGTVTINPKKLTLSAGENIYSKVYNGAAEVDGSVTDAGTDLYRLSHGAGIYIVNGLMGTDNQTENVIDGSACFNSSHSVEANAVTLSDLTLVSAATGEVNPNYYFDSAYTITLSAYIDRKELTLEWSNTDIAYDATEKCPTAQIETALPSCDNGNLIITVAGGQTNAGSYTASAVLTGKEGTETQAEDFSLTNSSNPFKINKLAVTIAPVSNPTPIIYDGKMHYLYNFILKSGTLVTGHSFSAGCASGGDTAGQHTIFAANAHITDSSGVDVTDNYDITYDSATLTIAPKVITVANLKCDSKVYDAATPADGISCDDIVFTAPVDGDDIRLDLEKITAAFVDSNVGNDKTVNFALADGVLIGEDASNYTLDKANSDLTCKADITPAELTVTVNDKTVVYGENCSFSVTYSGFKGSDTASVVTDAALAYTIGSTAETAVAYAVTTAADDYNIYANISGLSAQNYTFKAESGKLTVTKRPIAVGASADNAANPISKVYNGNTNAAVTTADYTFTGISGNSASGITNGDTVNLTYTAAYNSENVNGATKVDMTGLSIDNSNYELVTEVFEIKGKITPKAVEITAENKFVTYGEAAPAYTAVGTGFITGESMETLNSSAKTFTCAYNTSDPSNRGCRVGGYQISVSGYADDNGNYSITYKPGTLTVNKKAITVTATADKTSVSYGVDRIPTIGYINSALEYGEVFTVVVSGYGNLTYNMDGMTETSVTDGSETKTVINSIPGVYNVRPILKDGSNDVLTADNYTFTAAPVTVTVNKYDLKITGIKINPRVYDGTSTVYASQIDLSGITADGLLAVDREDFNSNKAARLGITATYSGDNGKDVATGKPVAIQIAFDPYLSARCYQDTSSQTTATSAITQRPVLVTADNKTTLYGTAAPDFTATYSKTKDGSGNTVADSGLVSGEAPDSTGISYSCTYTASAGGYSDTGSYTITPSALQSSASFNVSNYAPEYEDGTLTVNPNRLVSPTVSWSSTTPGLASWTTVSGIGSVDVESYTAVLYKDGAVVPGSTETITADRTQKKDYSSLIHSTGSGAYTVEVTANASKTYNEDNKNVLDSNPGSAPALYAAAVSLEFAADAISQDGKYSGTEADKQPTVNTLSSYVMIAGEKNIPISATLCNSSGYTIKSVTPGSTAVTVTNGTDTARSGASYSDTISMSSSLNSSDAIVILVALDAILCKINVVVTPEAGEHQASTTYGYSEGDRPVITATVTPLDSSTGYTYEYEWELNYGGKTVTYSTESGTSNTSTWTFPMSMKANTDTTYYSVRCVVTATRDDNKQTGVGYTGSKPAWVSSASYVTHVTVNRATFTAWVSMDDWTFGESRKDPTLIDVSVSDNEKANDASATFYYKKSSDDGNIASNWTTVKPVDAGTYDVKAVIPESQNYNEFETPTDSFTICPNKLTPAPANFSMTASSTAPYGKLVWEQVNGYVENGGVDGDNEVISVTYQVVQYEQNGTTVLKTYAPVSTTYLDITDDLQIDPSASYIYKVRAISSNTANCLNSDESVDVPVVIGGSITAIDTSTGESFTGSKLYDGNEVTISVSREGTCTYQWYKGATEISAATGASYSITDVDESGTYICVITSTVGSDVSKIYTLKLAAEIRKRTVTLTSEGQSKVYDGTPLTNNNVSITGDGWATGEDATYTFETSSTITNVGSVDNDFHYTLAAGAKAGNYTISEVPGVLSVTQRSITDTAVEYGTVSDVVYNDTDFTPEPTVTDKGLATNVVTSLVSDTDFVYSYQNNHNAGAATVTITGTGNYKDVKTIDFEIGKRPIAFVGDSTTVTYTGLKQEINTYTVYTDTAKTATDENSGLVSTHDAVLSYSAYGTEASDTAYSTAPNVTITAADEVKIYRKSDTGKTADLSANYDISTVGGTITINRSDDDWTIALAEKSYPYDKQAHCNPNTPIAAGTHTTVVGTTTYSYSFNETTGYTSDLSSLTQTNAGEYTIYVKAENSNYNKEAAYRSKLIISKIAPNIVFSAAVNNGILKDGVTYGAVPFSIEASHDEGDYASNAGMSFASDDPTQATVDSNGVVTILNVGDGKVTITVSMSESTNYLSETKTAEITINPCRVELDWTADTFTYDKTRKSITASVKNKQYSDTDADFTITYDTSDTVVGTAKSSNAAVDAGSYFAHVIGLGNANYTLMKSATEEVDSAKKDWTINYLETDAEATLVGTMGNNDWYVSNVDVVAPIGYTISLTEEGFADKLTYTEDNVYTVQYKLMNADGQISNYKTKSFKLDQTKPAGTITVGSTAAFSTKLDSITYQYIFPNSAGVVIDSNDGTGKTVGTTCSGIDKVEYMEVPEGDTFDASGTWQTYSEFTVSAVKKEVVYARITDKAGNFTIINSDGIVVYTNATVADSISYTRTTLSDVSSGIDFKGNTLKSVYFNDAELLSTDYEVKDGVLSIGGAWLETLSAGNYTLTVHWYPADVTGTTIGTTPTDSTVNLEVKLHERTLALSEKDGNVVDSTNAPVSKTYNKTAVNNAALTCSTSDSATVTPASDLQSGTVTYWYRQVKDGAGNDVTGSAAVNAAPDTAGTYEVYASIAANDHYIAATSAAKNIVISQKTVNIIGVTAEDRTFDLSCDIVIKPTGTLQGVESGDTVTFVQPTKGVTADAVPGEDKAVTLTDAPTALNGADAGNYRLGTINDVTVTITRATGDIDIISMYGKTYDAEAIAPPTYTVSVPGAETVEYKLSGADDDTYTTEKPIAAGMYVVRVMMAETEYYSESSKTATFTISPRPVTASWTPAELTYNGEAQLPELTLGNVCTGDTVTPTVSGYGTDVGNYTASLDSISSTNYAMPANTTYPFRIVPRAVTIEVNAKEKTYGDADPGFDGKVEGLVKAGDIGTVTYFRTSSDENAATYTNDLSASYTANSNYDVSVTKADFVINKRQLVLNWTGNGLEYNGKEQSVTAALDNIASFGGTPDYVAIKGYTKTTNATDAGSYTAAVTGFNGTALVNYILPELEHEWEILPRSLSDEHLSYGYAKGHTADYAVGITVADIKAETYDGNAHTPDAAVYDSLIGSGTTLVSGIDYDFEYVKNVNSGEAEIRITGKGNYRNTIVKKFTINPKRLSLVWTEDDFVYDGTEKVMTASVSGALDGAKVFVNNYTGNRAANAGSYIARAISLGGNDAGNYTLNGSPVTRSWSINKALITLKANDQTSTVGESLKTLTYEVTAGKIYGDDDLGDIVLTTTAKDIAGEYDITINVTDPNPNYDISVDTGKYTLKASSGNTGTVGGTEIIIYTPVSTPRPSAAVSPSPTVSPSPSLSPSPTPSATPAVKISPSVKSTPEVKTPQMAGTYDTGSKGGAEAFVAETHKESVSKWALLNLIFAILIVLCSGYLIVSMLLKKKKKQEEDYYTENAENKSREKNKRNKLWRYSSSIPAIAAIISFVLTEDIRLPMTFVDKWTVLMAVIALIQAAVAIMCLKKQRTTRMRKHLLPK